MTVSGTEINQQYLKFAIFILFIVGAIALYTIGKAWKPKSTFPPLLIMGIMNFLLGVSFIKFISDEAIDVKLVNLIAVIIICKSMHTKFKMTDGRND